MLFAIAVAVITVAAAWLAYELVHETLGGTGGGLAAVVAALLVGGPLAVVGLVIWGPQEAAPPRRPVRRAVPEGTEHTTTATRSRGGRS
jgi:hypothetical protein